MDLLIIILVIVLIYCMTTTEKFSQWAGNWGGNNSLWFGYGGEPQYNDMVDQFRSRKEKSFKRT